MNKQDQQISDGIQKGREMSAKRWHVVCDECKKNMAMHMSNICAECWERIAKEWNDGKGLMEDL